MSVPGEDAQRELEQRALRNVRQLVDKIERSDEVDQRAQKRLLVAIIVGAVLVALGIAAAILFGGQKAKPVAIDPAKLPPVRAGPAK